MNFQDDIRVEHWKNEACPELLFSSTSYERFHFENHFHNYYTVIRIRQGINEGFTGKTGYRIGSGSILAINPAAIHAGHSFGQDRLFFESVLFDDLLLKEVTSLLEITTPGDLLFQHDPISDPILLELLDDLLRLSRIEHAGKSVFAAKLLFFERLISCYCLGPGQSKGARQRAYLKRARAYLTEHYKEPVTLGQLASHAGISPYHLSREFKRNFRQTPFEFLRNFRIEKSKEALVKEKLIIEIACELGFFDHSHFIKCFYRNSGTTPSAYKRLHPSARGPIV